MRPVILPYNKFSQSAKALQKWLKENGYPKIKRTLNPKENRFVINWGSSKVEINYGLNQRCSVSWASDKLLTFLALQHAGISIPDFTTSTEEAQKWIDAGEIVVGRKLLKGHSGKGIILFDSETITSDLICPLYTKYKKKKYEYRIHVFHKTVIDFQQKKKRKGESVGSTKIRNHANGWVYCRDDVVLPEDAATEAVNAISALDLDFGAVDLIYNEKENKSYVLEVNTAPGLFGTTLENYGKAIKSMMEVVC